MKEPSGEMVDLDFYFGDRCSADAMRDIVSYLLSNGASFSGEIIQCEFAGARTAHMRGIYSHPISQQSLTEQAMASQLQSADVRVTKVGLWNAIGLSKKCPEIVTFNGMSAEAPPNESNSIAIVGEGWHFSTPGYEKERNKDARKCYARFIGVCKALQPAYAAILNEDSLPCRFDLQKGSQVFFSNFFVSERTFGSSMLTRIASMYQDSYLERSPEGLYVATWMFAPNEIAIDRKLVAERSKRVASMLSS